MWSQIARRMALLVIVDLACWLPLAICGLAATFAGTPLVGLSAAKVREVEFSAREKLQYATACTFVFVLYFTSSPSPGYRYDFNHVLEVPYSLCVLDYTSFSITLICNSKN